MDGSSRNITRAIELSRELLFCADRGDIQRDDSSCGVLYGIIRDCAYKILDAAQREMEFHKQRGTWAGDVA